MRIFMVGEDGNLARSLTQAIEEAFPDTVWVNNSSVTYVPKYMKRRMHKDAWCEEFNACSPESIKVMCSTYPDLIINTAGLVGSLPCYGDELNALYSNYVVAQNICDAAHQCNAKVLHLASTTPYATTDTFITEYTEPNFFQTTYSMTKLLGERAVEQLPLEQQLIVRVMFAYGGIRDRTSVIAMLIDRYVRQDFTHNVQNLDILAQKPPLYIKDLVEGIIALMKIDATGTYIVANPSCWPVYTDVLDLLKEFGVPSTGIEWDSDKDGMKNHLSKAEKFLAATGLSEKGWPRWSLSDSIAEMIEERQMLWKLQR